MRKVALIGLAGFFVSCWALATHAQDAKSPTIKEIMGKLTKGQNSLTTVIGKELNTDEPVWDDIKKQSKEFAAFAEALAKNKPPKGDGKSWTQLTSAYADSAKALSEAADKMDKKAAMTAHKKLAGSCMNCHRAHRGKT